MINKKGFTLMELLAVILILGILSFIAVPNVISIVENNKKDMMLSDARKLISQAKYQVNIDKTIRDSKNKKFTFNELNTKNDIKSDPNGGAYDNSSSYVHYQVNASGVTSYCVYLVGSQYKLSTSTDGCVAENDLFNRSNVREKN